MRLHPNLRANEVRVEEVIDQSADVSMEPGHEEHELSNQIDKLLGFMQWSQAQGGGQLNDSPPPGSDVGIVNRAFAWEEDAEGFKAPGVVVSFTTDPDIQSGKKFLNEGLQTAAGVPLQCDEGADFKTFRVGLFGLEKWHNVDKTVANLAGALDRIGVMERVAETVAC
jgi:hypothetical protein